MKLLRGCLRVVLDRICWEVKAEEEGQNRVVSALFGLVFREPQLQLAT